MKIKWRYLVLIVIFIILAGGTYFYISPNPLGENWGEEIIKSLEPNSVWKYENSKEDFQMELIIPDTDNPFADNIINYVHGNRSGDWYLTLLDDKNMVEVGYSIDNSFYRMWRGKLEVKDDIIKISEISECEDFSIWIENEMIPKEYAEDRVPEGIDVIELIRIK